LEDKGDESHSYFFQKIFKKGIDKRTQVWYNNNGEYGYKYANIQEKYS
jgi:hypothetical protein